MGSCHGKETKSNPVQVENSIVPHDENATTKPKTPRQPHFSFYMPSPLPSYFKNSPASSSVNSTPLRIFKRPFPPPSPAKHIKAFLARRHPSSKPSEATIPECEDVVLLSKNFGFLKNFFSKYELGEVVGRGHFGYACSAVVKKGELKGQEVAVKIIPKEKVRGFLWFFDSFTCDRIRLLLHC